MKDLIAFFIISIVIVSAYGQSYEVRGAGTVEANGIYVASGRINNKTCYKKGEYTLLYKGCVSKWMITSPGGNLYRNSHDTELPPRYGWQTGCDPSSKEPGPEIIPINTSDTQPKQLDYEKVTSNQFVIPVIRNVFSSE